MNLPNKLTVLRVLLIPVFLCLYLNAEIPNNYLWALVVFAGASVTDLLDGKIARSRGLVTDFGKLMDPLADKLLVMSAMVCMIPTGMVHALAVIVILAREFLVTSIRLVAAGSGQVIAADIWGKMKTVSQMIWLCYGMLLLWVFRNLTVYTDAVSGVDGILWYAVFDGLTLIVLAFTVFSGINYCWKNRHLFADA